MKKHAQAILLFTGYPLEPIVALEMAKSYQLQTAVVPSKTKAPQSVRTNALRAAAGKR